MPLIKCPDCDRACSDLAASCLQCGRPMAAASVPDPPPERVELARVEVVTTEESVLTRNRGCGDLILWPLLGLVGLVALAMLWLGSQ